MRSIFIILMLFIAIAITLVLMPSKQTSAPMPWEVTLMSDNRPQVLGIHLGTTTYLKAQQVLHEYGDVAIFTQENKPTTVEAFFTSVNLGGLSSKVVLNIEVPSSKIEHMLTTATNGKLQASGAKRYELSNESKRELLSQPINALTYIPSIRLTKEMIKHRFGQAEDITQTVEQEIWHYPNISLMIHFDEKGKSVLQYQ